MRRIKLTKILDSIERPKETTLEPNDAPIRGYYIRTKKDISEIEIDFGRRYKPAYKPNEGKK